MPGRHHLFVPGRTNTPHRILRALPRAAVDHGSVALADSAVKLAA